MLQNIIFLLICWDSMLKRIFDLAVLTSADLDHLLRNTPVCKDCVLVTSHLVQEFTTLPSGLNAHSHCSTLHIFFATCNKHDNACHTDTQAVREETHRMQRSKKPVYSLHQIVSGLYPKLLRNPIFSCLFHLWMYIFLPKMRQRILSSKATVDTVSQGNILQNPKSN